MSDGSVKSQRFDIIHEWIGQHIQVRDCTTDSAPDEGTVADFPSQGDLSYRGP